MIKWTNQLVNQRRLRRSLKKTQPRASIATYRFLHDEVRNRENPAIDEFIRSTGYEISEEFLEDLALHTQVVIKKSALNYQHGRILYAVLRKYAEDFPNEEEVRILETGTARGFSALCMSRALGDAGVPGCIITIDRLPHHVQMMWNCIDDHDGTKSRASLLEPWSVERDRCIFLTGESKSVLASLGMSRIHLAFLDGEHSKEAVLREFAFVESRQVLGDIVVIDDVTPLKFPGVVSAVAWIERAGKYKVTQILSSNDRGYAIAHRIRN